MKRILIDTDVLLDFFLDRDPFSESAEKILSLCNLKQVTGCITPVIISNVYYLLRKIGNHEKVMEKLADLISITDVLVIDASTISRAIHSDFNDFEDALQNYAAESDKKVDVIVTRNTKDYKSSSLAVMTPDAYLKMRVTLK
ncbi:PIN domain-containing protein [Dyadobacter sp. CY323]|uniref:PIN domain-containing protein n=1 Tax=Dyadobacter sp. CY323 TaxID=2907302 RepID=UPI001F1DD7FC|nr:PIN domain-containing protein [Dyadobacter sp. CY323]MCE6987982.1 PIN domain-containing protein [Dyadobacter sp. CY323]